MFDKVTSSIGGFTSGEAEEELQDETAKIKVSRSNLYFFIFILLLYKKSSHFVIID